MTTTNAGVTFLVGYCGSGKTTYGTNMQQKNPDKFVFYGDGDFLYSDEHKRRKVIERLIEDIKRGMNCIIEDIGFTGERNRNRLKKILELNLDQPLEFNCIYFEDNCMKANLNCMSRYLRGQKDGDYGGMSHIEINGELRKHYKNCQSTCPLEIKLDNTVFAVQALPAR